jgi:hypothetical protein
MKKNFLFINYSWVANATYIFKAFEKCGYTCDFVTEKQIQHWQPTCDYENIIVYLHDYAPWVNNILDLFPNSFFVQHDDTDFPNVMKYYKRQPDLIMHRELSSYSTNPYIAPTYGMHFPVASAYNQNYQEKNYDVCFLGMPNHPRRNIFIDTIEHLANNNLKHLKWFIKYQPTRNWYEFQQVVNSSKIGLHFPGNSWDSLRIWELASANCCLVMPKVFLHSFNETGREFNEYITFDMSCKDLASKIEFCLADNFWQQQAEKTSNQYKSFHSPEQCFSRYHNIVFNHNMQMPRPVVAWEGKEVFDAWRNNPNV